MNIVLQTGETRGSKSRRAKLNEAAILEIRRLFRAKPAGQTRNDFARQIAPQFGVNWRTICSVLAGTIWGWLKDPQTIEESPHA